LLEQSWIDEAEKLIEEEALKRKRKLRKKLEKSLINNRNIKLKKAWGKLISGKNNNLRLVDK
jgi:hypothetical protein